MKILYVGDFSNIGSADFSRVRGFLKNSCKVICFNCRYKKQLIRKNIDQKSDFKVNTLSIRKNYKRLFSILKVKKKFGVLIFKLNTLFKKKNYIPFFDKINSLRRFFLFGNWKINKQLINEVKKNKYDLVFMAKVDSINYKSIKEIKKHSKTWYFFMDPLEIAVAIKAYRYATLSTWSSATFSSVHKLFKKHGANNFFITEGYDSDVYFPNEKNQRKEIEALFVGSINLKRANYINFLLKNKVNVICYGVGWKNNPIFVSEQADKCRISKVILNFTKGNIGFSDRVLLSMGTGSLLISEYCKDLERFFTKSKHLEWFQDENDLLNLIKFYFSSTQKREEIASNGYKFVFENFSWKKITEKIVKIINTTLLLV